MHCKCQQIIIINIIHVTCNFSLAVTVFFQKYFHFIFRKRNSHTSNSNLKSCWKIKEVLRMHIIGAIPKPNIQISDKFSFRAVRISQHKLPTFTIEVISCKFNFFFYLWLYLMTTSFERREMFTVSFPKCLNEYQMNSYGKDLYFFGHTCMKLYGQVWKSCVCFFMFEKEKREQKTSVI